MDSPASLLTMPAEIHKMINDYLPNQTLILLDRAVPEEESPVKSTRYCHPHRQVLRRVCKQLYDQIPAHKHLAVRTHAFVHVYEIDAYLYTEQIQTLHISLTCPWQRPGQRPRDGPGALNVLERDIGVAPVEFPARFPLLENATISVMPSRHSVMTQWALSQLMDDIVSEYSTPGHVSSDFTGGQLKIMGAGMKES